MVGGDDIGAQAREALRRVQSALEEAGAELEDVLRTRMFVTDISRWEEVARDADFPGFRRVYAHDPFGNRLEFLQPA